MARKAKIPISDAARAEPASSQRRAERKTPPEVIPFRLREFAASDGLDSKPGTDPGGSSRLDVRIELGRARIALQDALELRAGSVVALDQSTGDPVDIYSGGRLVARGQVVALDGNFCVRVTEVIAAEQAA